MKTRRSASLHFRIPVLATLLALAACGGGGGGGDGPPPGPAPSPLVTVIAPSGTQSVSVSIPYSLIDAESDLCSILVEYSISGGAFATATRASGGGEGLLGLTSSPSPGTSHSFEWNSLIDGVGTSAAALVQIRITPSDAAGTGGPSTTGAFLVDNSGNSAPSIASITTPGASFGLVVITYNLADAQSNECSLAIRYSTNGGVSYLPATAGPGPDGLLQLTSSPGAGTINRVVWNSFADGVALAGAVPVLVQLTPTDGSLGAATATGSFSLNNAAMAIGGSIGSPFPLQSNTNYDATSVATDGKYLYVAGHNFDAWRIQKINAASGAVAWTRDSDPSGGDDRVLTIVIDDTYLYLAGFQEVAPSGSPTERMWRLEKRLLTDGSLVSGFGTSGAVVTANLGDSPVNSMAIDSTCMYVTGIVEYPIGSGTYDARIEKRLLGDGSLVAEFGTGGVITSAGGLAIAVDGTSMYLVGTQDFATDAKIRIEKRTLTSGSLVTGFGTGGILTSNLNATAGAWELITSIAIDASNMYLFETIETGSGTGIYPWRLEKRALDTGSLVGSVAGSGSNSMGPGGGHIAIDGTSLYVTGHDSASATDGRWRFEKRNLSDLALDTSFDGDGIVVFNPTVGSDEEFANTLVVAAGVLYVVGNDTAVREWRIEGRWK